MSVSPSKELHGYSRRRRALTGLRAVPLREGTCYTKNSCWGTNVVFNRARPRPLGLTESLWARTSARCLAPIPVGEGGGLGRGAGAFVVGVPFIYASDVYVKRSAWDKKRGPDGVAFF